MLKRRSSQRPTVLTAVVRCHSRLTRSQHPSHRLQTRRAGSRARAHADSARQVCRIASERVESVLHQYISFLQALTRDRQSRLDDNKRLWQYYWDMAELEQGFKELEQVKERFKALSFTCKTIAGPLLAGRWSRRAVCAVVA